MPAASGAELLGARWGPPGGEPGWAEPPTHLDVGLEAKRLTWASVSLSRAVGAGALQPRPRAG